MNQNNYQEKIWSGEFGKEYTNSNFWTPSEYNKVFCKWTGFTRLEINHRFLDQIDKSSKVLEAGCNVANQLALLENMGFENLYGIEINKYAIEEAHRRSKKFNIIEGNISSIPYEDNFFDLVFTSGVLMHISPQNIDGVLKELFRVSKRYIWGYENYNEEYKEWKREKTWWTDFSELFLQKFPGEIVLIKKEIFPLISSPERRFSMYLLEKQSC